MRILLLFIILVAQLEFPIKELPTPTPTIAIVTPTPTPSSTDNPEWEKYVNKYIPVEPGEPDYHNPYAPDYSYGDIHHRLGPDCPQSYYDLCEIWKVYGEMYNRGEINKNQLIEMDHYIFAVNKGTTDPQKVRELVDEYYRIHFNYTP